MNTPREETIAYLMTEFFPTSWKRKNSSKHMYHSMIGCQLLSKRGPINIAKYNIQLRKRRYARPFRKHSFNKSGLNVSTPLRPAERLRFHKLIVSGYKDYRRRRCGCRFYEEHQRECEEIEVEKLDEWDPHVQSTYLGQALGKYILQRDLLFHFEPSECFHN